MLRKFWNDEAGVIISAELVLVMTITVLAMVVGLQSLSKVINHELNDLAQAFSTIDQSFSYDGITNPGDCSGGHAGVEGSKWEDRADDCDCVELVQDNPSTKIDTGNGKQQTESGSSATNP